MEDAEGGVVIASDGDECVIGQRSRAEPNCDRLSRTIL
jgi:hypothetical protein